MSHSEPTIGSTPHEQQAVGALVDGRPLLVGLIAIDGAFDTSELAVFRVPTPQLAHFLFDRLAPVRALRISQTRNPWPWSSERYAMMQSRTDSGRMRMAAQGNRRHARLADNTAKLLRPFTNIRCDAE